MTRHEKEELCVLSASIPKQIFLSLKLKYNLKHFNFNNLNFNKYSNEPFTTAVVVERPQVSYCR